MAKSFWQSFGPRTLGSHRAGTSPPWLCIGDKKNWSGGGQVLHTRYTRRPLAFFAHRQPRRIHCIALTKPPPRGPCRNGKIARSDCQRSLCRLPLDGGHAPALLIGDHDPVVEERAFAHREEQFRRASCHPTHPPPQVLRNCSQFERRRRRIALRTLDSGAS